MNPCKRPARRAGRVFPVLFVLAALLLSAACARDDPQAVLDAAVGELQAALEAKAVERVLDVLHSGFAVQGTDNGRDWARRTMMVMFMRHKNITVAVLYRDNRLDPRVPDRAVTEAEVTLLGAENLLPENASHYRVHLEWGLEAGAWKVTRLAWK
ncbi:MAG: DUF736 domain-containing protein [Azoarcus sp.]|jgi:hypothetical protein|nr:DUF736 domain-containing protein [Azoarcus sp.]